jgi:hypothetical protein
MTTTNDVTVIMAAKNDCQTLQLTLYSFLRYATSLPPFLVADNGSESGALDFLKSQQWITVYTKADRDPVRAGPDYTQHGPTLDWLAGKVKSPYFLTIDSDMEFLAAGWLEDMLELMSRDNLDALGEFDPGMGAYQSRLLPHLSLLRTAVYRQVNTSFTGFTRIGDEAEAERWRSRPPAVGMEVGEMNAYKTARFFDTGALLFHTLTSSGFTWADTPRCIRDKYNHIRHMAWGGQETRSHRYQSIYRQNYRYTRDRLTKLLSDNPHSA